MFGKNAIQLLISPKETAELSIKAGIMISSINIARDIEKAYLELETCNDCKWLHYGVLAAIFESGRIQGIREERARKRGLCNE